VARVTDSRTLVYLVRHGQTALNESGVLRGLLDPQLNDTGRRQASLLGQVLGRRHPSLVAASPLRRARETAQPTADRAGLIVTTDRCLTDRDYGPWAGTPKARWPRSGARWTPLPVSNRAPRSVTGPSAG
jgi:broad specificity phosphatase PhoE